MRHLRLPESMNAYVEKFRIFYHRPTGTPKMAESNMARISRVKSFLYYMSIGQKKITDWKFLMNLPRLNQWLQDITNSGKTITTVRYYIHNMVEFIDFMLGSNPPHSKLTHEQAREIRMFLEKARRNTSRDITIHSNRVKHDKMMKIPSIASIETCLKLAPAKIEELLGELELNSSRTGTSTPKAYMAKGYVYACYKLVYVAHVRGAPGAQTAKGYVNACYRLVYAVLLAPKRLRAQTAKGYVYACYRPMYAELLEPKRLR
ncbi:uncharacterized protein LOC106511395, partial [Austrofundulus limnaeus]|uniref:Uncharacterized protein LOC106511395 n=1 Tax=Austrofundulus limnaeus TaxID=52670 RepID=A0A2I4AJF7_AUSLI